MTLRLAAACELAGCPPDRRSVRGAVLASTVVLAVVGLFSSLVARKAHSAKADDGWIGKRVVQKHARFDLKIENSVIDRKEILAIYRVEQMSGPWLWLKAPTHTRTHAAKTAADRNRSTSTSRTQLLIGQSYSYSCSYSCSDPCRENCRRPE